MCSHQLMVAWHQDRAAASREAVIQFRQVWTCSSSYYLCSAVHKPAVGRSQFWASNILKSDALQEARQSLESQISRPRARTGSNLARPEASPALSFDQDNQGRDDILEPAGASAPLHGHDAVQPAETEPALDTARSGASLPIRSNLQPCGVEPVVLCTAELSCHPGLAQHTVAATAASSPSVKDSPSGAPRQICRQCP